MPHPEQQPMYTKSDYIRNMVFAPAKVGLLLYIEEGASLHELRLLAQELQESIQRAFHCAVQEAGFNVGGPFPDPPTFGEGLSDDNPFNEPEQP